MKYSSSKNKKLAKNLYNGRKSLGLKLLNPQSECVRLKTAFSSQFLVALSLFVPK